jgi:excinuclease ABC subunit B
MFNLVSPFAPTGDQPQAIDKLVDGIKNNLKNQVLLGVTGSGKTFTMANIIKKLNMPALIISHNKTLAGQLYQEFRDFFPENAVSYFVSYYDFYQPEAYVPQTDTYIEKEADINDLIDKLRLQSTTNILTRNDTIVVASVSCIYNIGSPEEYKNFILQLKVGDRACNWNNIAVKMVDLRYERSEFEFKRGSFRIRGTSLDIYPAYEDAGYRITVENNKIVKIIKFEPISGKELSAIKEGLTIYPAKHYLTSRSTFEAVEKKIRRDLEIEYRELKEQNKLIEAERLLRRVNYDLEMVKEVGYVNGIENYSRYLDRRKPGDPPYTLVNYFRQAYGDNFLVFIDESHMTVPQLRGMYNGDHSRKKTLIDFGFRLRAALDNRPLKFEEFYRIPQRIIYVSATPDRWEIDQSQGKVVEQLIRPTGLVDPKIIIKPGEGEIPDLIAEIEKRVKIGEKVLVTTLTKKIAEDLTGYLKDKKIRADYLHSDIQTLERSDILDSLRKNEFDVLIGVNLLREGLDLPEVSLVAILDADKEGFLRSKTALIQTMGRAARNVNGEVIIYADVVTKSIKQAVDEIERRREHQLEYNRRNNIVPQTIKKPIREKIAIGEEEEIVNSGFLSSIKPEALTPYDSRKIVKKLEREMKKQADQMNFELAIKIRDKIRQMRES